MYCRDCNEILYPMQTSNFAAHNVVTFQCVNPKCLNRDEIYLNHCLNRQCNSIIDSRVSKKCNNNLYICDNCGCCCSNDMFQRRFNNLKLAGSNIPLNLMQCIEKKLGHRDKEEYFCYRCGDEMNEIRSKIFHCKTCNIDFDTLSYKTKKRSKNSTLINDIESNFLEDEMPF